MKYVWLAGLLLWTLSSAWAQNKTLVKTMDPQETSAIQLDFRNLGVDALPWDEGFIRLELEIIANFPEAIMAQLVKAGRYTLTSSIEEDVFVIRAENMDKTVTIGGKDLDDHVRVFVKTPGYYGLSEDGLLQKNFNSDQLNVFAERAKTKTDMLDLIKNFSKIKENVDVQYRFVFKKDESTPDLPDNAKALTPASTLEEVEVLYGEILLDGQPLDLDE